ncbi:MAG: GIY-YIG nuclease family protein, partial [Muribaculaceae bacterium]|nr:GIY-YIG nuclease family protein [Muribaculaceae bacterium]
MTPDSALIEKVRALPEQPGVYVYYDASGKVIYVGKAVNLRRRVSSYFNRDHESAKTRRLVANITDLKYHVVNNENDALILENSLIKRHKPRYNILLKDDKSYP